MNIVYIHGGYSWYLPIAIKNGRQFAGDNVYFLGDTFGRVVASWLGAQTAKLSSHFESSDEFASHYTHHSTLPVDFELFCIQRWFVLRDFMKAKGLKQCVYLDTDNLVCAPLEPFMEKLQSYGLSFTGYSAHICFVNDWEVLDRFCSFVLDIYSDKERHSELVAWKEKMLAEAGQGGVSDMTMFYWFYQKHPDLLAKYSDIFEESPFDVSLDDVREWQADEQGLKKITWEGSTPVAHRKEGSAVNLATLHHQGTGKSALHKHASLVSDGSLIGRSILMTIQRLYNGIRRIRRKIC